MDVDLEAKVKTCEKCLRNQKMPPAAPLHPWKYPHMPWSRLCGSSLWQNVVNYCWCVFKVDRCPCDANVHKYCNCRQRQIFSMHGLPEIIVSDNGSNFTNKEFETFLKLNGLKHIRTAPHHPASNGRAERAVQTVKEGIIDNSNGKRLISISRAFPPLSIRCLILSSSKRCFLITWLVFV